MEKEKLEELFKIANYSLDKIAELNRVISKEYIPQLDILNMLSLGEQTNEIKIEIEFLKCFIDFLSRELEKKG